MGGDEARGAILALRGRGEWRGAVPERRPEEGARSAGPRVRGRGHARLRRDRNTRGAESAGWVRAARRQRLSCCRVCRRPSPRVFGAFGRGVRGGECGAGRVSRWLRRPPSSVR